MQFHPESVATAYGKQILENFRNITQEYWQKQDWQPANKVPFLLVYTAVLFDSKPISDVM